MKTHFRHIYSVNIVFDATSADEIELVHVIHGAEYWEMLQSIVAM